MGRPAYAQVTKVAPSQKSTPGNREIGDSYQFPPCPKNPNRMCLLFLLESQLLGVIIDAAIADRVLCTLCVVQ